jgi:hypothetical protein
MKIDKGLLAGFACAMAFLMYTPAVAIPAMDVQFEDLMAQSGDVKKSLNLNPNQQVLWQQSESKMRAILAARMRRRDQLQSGLQKELGDTRTELRDLAKKVDAEADLNYQENKQLRELWLTVNDALTDAQRQTILLFLADRLQLVPDQGCKCSDQPRARGTSRQKPGGLGGGLPQ